MGTVAPAPLWRLTALIVERFPGMVLTSQSLPEEEVEAGVMSGDVDLGISLRPHPLPTVPSSWLMEENLAVALPTGHALADRELVTSAELDGETFLLLSGIGFWRERCDRFLPHSEFVEQEDRGVFEQLVRSSPLPHFTTDAPALSEAAPGRVVVPISDDMAHATFYLLLRPGGRSEAAQVFDWISSRAG